MMLNTSLIFVAAVTFLGCWFVSAFFGRHAARRPGADFAFGRAGALGILACGAADLAMSAVMWHRELGTAAGLTAWAVVCLASWQLLARVHGRSSLRGHSLQGHSFQRPASHPSTPMAQPGTPQAARRTTATNLVAIFLFVVAILAFFKQTIDTWRVD